MSKPLLAAAVKNKTETKDRQNLLKWYRNHLPTEVATRAQCETTARKIVRCNYVTARVLSTYCYPDKIVASSLKLVWTRIRSSVLLQHCWQIMFSPCLHFSLLAVIEEKGIRLKLSITDTPGFGDHVDNTNWYEAIALNCFVFAQGVK